MSQCLVVDSNMLQTATLRTFFSKAPGNVAVLPDFVWIEIYKQQSLVALQAAFSVIRDFPDRLVFLRPNGALAALDPQQPDLIGRMLDIDAGDHLRPYFRSRCRQRLHALELSGGWRRQDRDQRRFPPIWGRGTCGLFRR